MSQLRAKDLRTVADLGLSTRAVNVLWSFYETADDMRRVSAVAVRARLVTRAGGDESSVFRMLRRFKGCGVETARQWCEALGFPVPAPMQSGQHCPSCTCWKRTQ